MDLHTEKVTESHTVQHKWFELQRGCNYKSKCFSTSAILIKRQCHFLFVILSTAIQMISQPEIIWHFVFFGWSAPVFFFVWDHWRGREWRWFSADTHKPSGHTQLMLHANLILKKRSLFINPADFHNSLLDKGGEGTQNWSSFGFGVRLSPLSKNDHFDYCCSNLLNVCVKCSSSVRQFSTLLENDSSTLWFAHRKWIKMYRRANPLEHNRKEHQRLEGKMLKKG